MKAVWAELVPVPKKALTTHLTAVLAHLKAGLTDRLWRAREASCLALADLLPGREWDELKDSLEALTTALALRNSAGIYHLITASSYTALQTTPLASRSLPSLD